MYINRAILFAIKYLTAAAFLCLFIGVFTPLWVASMLLDTEKIENFSFWLIGIADNIMDYLEKKLC